MLDIDTQPDHDRRVPAFSGARRAALASLYEVHSGAVYGLVCSIGGAELAADVTVGLFVHLWHHPAEMDAGHDELRGRLLTAARRMAFAALRSESAEPHVPTESLDDRIVEALGELPAREREALLAAYYGQGTYREVAHALGASEGEVRASLRAGLLHLRSALERSVRRGASSSAR